MTYVRVRSQGGDLHFRSKQACATLRSQDESEVDMLTPAATVCSLARGREILTRRRYTCSICPVNNLLRGYSLTKIHIDRPCMLEDSASS